MIPPAGTAGTIGPAWPSYTARARCPEGEVWVRLAWEGGRPLHCYVNSGKAGTMGQGVGDGYGRLISELLRHEPADRVIELLRGISHDRSGGLEGASIADAVAIGLEKILAYRLRERAA